MSVLSAQRFENTKLAPYFSEQMQLRIQFQMMQCGLYILYIIQNLESSPRESHKWLEIWKTLKEKSKVQFYKAQK